MQSEQLHPYCMTPSLAKPTFKLPTKFVDNFCSSYCLLKSSCCMQQFLICVEHRYRKPFPLSMKDRCRRLAQCLPICSVHQRQKIIIFSVRLFSLLLSVNEFLALDFISNKIKQETLLSSRRKYKLNIYILRIKFCEINFRKNVQTIRIVAFFQES